MRTRSGCVPALFNGSEPDRSRITPARVGLEVNGSRRHRLADEGHGALHPVPLRPGRSRAAGCRRHHRGDNQHEGGVSNGATLHGFKLPHQIESPKA